MASFIWDMDGTLVDSYPAIVPAVQEVCAAHGYDFTEAYIHEAVIRTSVGAFIHSIADEEEAEVMIRHFDQLNDQRIGAIVAMPHAKETLAALTEAGNLCFVYTHRGASCHAILENTGLLPYFTEVVTALDGFARKPEPDAILYLMDKYGLAKDSCFYVGDRSIDIEAAYNAGIGGILYLLPGTPGAAGGKETLIVKDLLEITHMDISRQMSLYDHILKAMKDGMLEDDFSLPETEGDQEVSFADGAIDGITVYHMSPRPLDESGAGLMAEALQAAGEGRFREADAAFAKLGSSFRAISIIDDLQRYILDHTQVLPAENVYRTALYLIFHSADRESVKFGLSMLELFRTDDEAVKEAVRRIGASDEFTIFSVWNMLRWEDGNSEIFDLIRKVRGWGRIHALERLEPETPQIRRWMLFHGIDNDVMPAYSALTVWEKADIPALMERQLTKDEYEAVGRIITALQDEGPVPGISAIENAEDFIRKYRNLANDF